MSGNETTATLLSRAIYSLLMNPRAHKKLTQEIRTTFQTETDINLLSVGELKYMLAVLDEGLRVIHQRQPAFHVLPLGRAKGLDGQFVPGCGEDQLKELLLGTGIFRYLYNNRMSLASTYMRRLIILVISPGLRALFQSGLILKRKKGGLNVSNDKISGW